MYPSSRKALRLFEILLLIFEHVSPPEDDSSEPNSARQTLAAAARVCKAFSEPALIVLWRRIDTLAPLVRLLAAAKLTERDAMADESDFEDLGRHGVLIIADDISPEDWERFEHYAAYVRVFDSKLQEMGHQFAPITVHPSVYDCLLGMSEGRPLLPRLRELSWSQKATTGREYLALISTTLCRLHLRIEERRGYHPLFSRHDLERGGEPRQREYAARWILDTILSRAVKLEHLTLDGFHHLAMLAPLARCRHLRTLDISSSLKNRNVEFSLLVSTLAGVTTLTRLDLTINKMWGANQDLFDLIPPRYFNSLETLRLIVNTGSYPGEPASIFGATDFPRLRNLSIRFNTERDASVDSPERALRHILLLPAPFAHIRALYVRLDIRIPIFPALRAHWLPGTGVRLSLLLLPLASLYGLQKLHVVSGTQTRISCVDDDIHAISRQWANLMTLAISLDTFSGNISVFALDHMLRSWPKLEVLCLPTLIDFTTLQCVRPHRNLRRLSILSLPPARHVKEVKDFAVYLSMQFPNLQTEQPFPHLAFPGEDQDGRWTPCHAWWLILDLVRQAQGIIQSRCSRDQTAGVLPAQVPFLQIN